MKAYHSSYTWMVLNNASELQHLINVVEQQSKVTHHVVMVQTR